MPVLYLQVLVVARWGGFVTKGIFFSDLTSPSLLGLPTRLLHLEVLGNAPSRGIAEDAGRISILYLSKFHREPNLIDCYWGRCKYLLENTAITPYLVSVPTRSL